MMPPPYIFTDIWAEHLMLIDVLNETYYKERKRGWLLLISVGTEIWKSAKWPSCTHCLFCLRELRTKGPLCGTWVILPKVSAIFFVTHCLFVYLIYSSGNLYITQPSSVNSHSLTINRAAAPALPPTATCKLVTLNDSHMHRFTRMRGRRARRVWWYRVLCEIRGRGKCPRQDSITQDSALECNE